VFDENLIKIMDRKKKESNSELSASTSHPGETFVVKADLKALCHAHYAMLTFFFFSLVKKFISFFLFFIVFLSLLNYNA
jgi:hypothetical protein